MVFKDLPLFQTDFNQSSFFCSSYFQISLCCLFLKLLLIVEYQFALPPGWDSAFFWRGGLLSPFAFFYLPFIFQIVAVHYTLTVSILVVYALLTNLFTVGLED